MRYRREINAIGAFAVFGWRRAVADRIGLAGRALLYVVVLAIFWQLWQATPLGELAPSSAGPAPSPAAFLWYLAITEWVVFAVGMPYRDVEVDIRGGGIASALLRPLPYGFATLAQWLGGTAFHLLVIGGVGIAAASWLTGTIPLAPAMAPGLILAGFLAMALILLCHLQLGYATAWLGTASPPFWIWQKLTFVLGGLIMPLTLFPAGWRVAAGISPFASMLFGPASLAFDASLPHLAAVLSWQLIWLALLGAATVLLDRAVAARFLEHGV